MPHSMHTTPRASTPESTSIPYWNVNVPQDQWTKECPEWLLGKDARDIEILSTRESDYQRHSWSTVQQLISASNNRRGYSPHVSLYSLTPVSTAEPFSCLAYPIDSQSLTASTSSSAAPPTSAVTFDTSTASNRYTAPC